MHELAEASLLRDAGEIHVSLGADEVVGGDRAPYSVSCDSAAVLRNGDDICGPSQNVFCISVFSMSGSFQVLSNSGFSGP